MKLRPPIVVVHAGAGTWRYLDVVRDVAKVLKQALENSYKVLRTSNALEAVVEAVKVMEDSGILNAGLGSVTDVFGNIGMDAGLATSKGDIGAVANVKYPQNPILLAKYILEKTDHILIVGQDADELAKRLKLKKHPGPTDLVIKRYRELLRRLKEGRYGRFKRNIRLLRDLWGLGDTVGAVAIDSDGVLASAVSTGGIFLKLPGRVGDSAILGAGFYADENAASVATGIGETIIKGFLTLRISKYVAEGLNASQACEKVISEHTRIFGPDTAGVIAADRNGYVGASYNTEAMPWGVFSSDLGKPLLKGHRLLEK